MFDKENDPQILRATSPGKLIKYLVNDGEHVNGITVRYIPPPIRTDRGLKC